MILTGFYTSVERLGNKLLYRGYDDDGKKISHRIAYKPTLYLKSKKTVTDWKALDGTPVEPLQFGSMSEVKEFQKSYNGVAILSKFEMVNPKFNFYEDTQARFLEVDILDYKIICIYVPNGNPISTEKYTYKLIWLENFYSYCKSLVKTNKKIIIGGDFNIIQSNLDCYNDDDWIDDALFTIEVKKKLRQILHLGFYDSFRAKNSSIKAFSYWDYQSGAWQRDNGIRIDLILLTSNVIDELKDTGIHKEVRGQTRPSDHTPVWIKL